MLRLRRDNNVTRKKHFQQTVNAAKRYNLILSLNFPRNLIKETLQSMLPHENISVKLPGEVGKWMENKEIQISILHIHLRACNDAKYFFKRTRNY